METKTNEKFWNEMQEFITVLFKNFCTCLMLYNIHEVQETNNLLSYANKALNVLSWASWFYSICLDSGWLVEWYAPSMFAFIRNRIRHAYYMVT